MKTLTALLLLTLGLVTTHGAGTNVTANATNRLDITGMTCSSCAKGLAGELKLTPGVISADVTLSNNLAVVTFDTNRVNSARLIKAVEEAGFKAKLQKP